MAYFAPFIDAAGLHLPSYQDILENRLATYRTIYGQNTYLGPDSEDYQEISAFSLMLSDVMAGIQLAYNNRSPLTAVGAGLDGVLKLTGIARKPASFSTCQVTLTGTAGTTVNNGIIQDVNGFQWALPAQVIITGGSVTVTATCQTPGNIGANPGDIAIISTPTAGWTGVTNANAAVPGQPIEADSTLRARQALSVALPSLTMLAGTIAGIAKIPGVTRYNVVENPTGVTDALGNPPHSITAVVEGGTDLDVATAIYNNRGIGCLTNGTTTVTVTDPNTQAQMSISFLRPTYEQIYVSLDVHGLMGFTTATQDAIKAALVTYLNSLQIGESITVSALYAAAMSVSPSLTQPLFSIRALKVGTAPSPAGTSDIAIDFDQVAQSDTSKIGITIV